MRFWQLDWLKTNGIDRWRFLEELSIGTKRPFGIEKLLNNLLNHELPSRHRRLVAQSERNERWMATGWFVQCTLPCFFFLFRFSWLTGQCFKGLHQSPSVGHLYILSSFSLLLAISAKLKSLASSTKSKTVYSVDESQSSGQAAQSFVKRTIESRRCLRSQHARNRSSSLSLSPYFSCVLIIIFDDQLHGSVSSQHFILYSLQLYSLFLQLSYLPYRNIVDNS